MKKISKNTLVTAGTGFYNYFIVRGMDSGKKLIRVTEIRGENVVDSVVINEINP